MTPVSPDVILAGVRAGLEGQALDFPYDIYLTLRDRGRRVARGWGPDFAGLAQGKDFTTVEVTLTGVAMPLDRASLRKAQANAFRGLWGLGNAVARIGPLEMLARNLGPNAALRELGCGEAFQFAAQCFLVDVVRGRCVALHRGQRLVRQGDVSRASVQAMADGMVGWLGRQVGPDGRTTYKYWPSSGVYATSNNMIRQFMGTAALALAKGMEEAAGRNCAYNFGRFYRDEGDFGIIDEAGRVKLGAAAVALIALINRGEHRSHQAVQLRKFIEHMHYADGSFRTFLRPEGRNDCQNFYPGEAMLALARLHGVTGEAALIAWLESAFDHYRDWHRAQRNPAFVPWHTMALCYLHGVTGRDDVRDFVFEINDWLIDLQANDPAQPDTIGEFYDACRAHFGPPHASSTGVYLEGLIDAWSLAKRLKDPRATAYRHAILRGLRSLRQLQYRNEDAMFYIRHKARVRGAVRTSTHNNEVRIDNVQHGLMAIWQILDRFGADDWQM